MLGIYAGIELQLAVVYEDNISTYRYLRFFEALLRIHVNLHRYRSLLPTCVRSGHCRTSARVYTYIYIYIYIYIYKLSSSRLLPGDGFSVVSLYDNISILLI